MNNDSKGSLSVRFLEAFLHKVLLTGCVNSMPVFSI